jgi:hypothetical protein
VRNLLDGVTYRPGWELDIVRAEFLRGSDWSKSVPWMLTIRAKVEDSTKPGQQCYIMNNTVLPPHFHDDMPNSEFLGWLLHVLLGVERHECQEFLQVNGIPPFDPHRGGV